MTQIQLFMDKALHCAYVMFESANYLQKELSSLKLTDELRKQTEDLCNALVSTKHDIISEVYELDELVESESSSLNVRAKVNLILEWFREDITQIHQLVMNLKFAYNKDSEYSLALTLIMEIATNIFNAFNSTKSAANSFSKEGE